MSGSENGSPPTQADEISLPALRVRQGEGRTLYTFAVDGKLLNQFAAISRLRRDVAGAILGYQRPEVLSHIAEIRRYLESSAPMIPNAIVIAFDERVRFSPHSGLKGSPYAEHGELRIPLGDPEGAGGLPGWIVDGQQRAAAIREARVDSFPICVTAFITSDLQEQREQFILVNTTKPLPKGLIYELLPATESRLPTLLQRRRFPAYLMDCLNHEPESPFYRRIRTPTTPGGVVKDNSVLRMLENSLSDGALHQHRNAASSGGDERAMLLIINAFWGAVGDVFAQAWVEPPQRSRLTHGAGIVAMGYVMDAIADRYRRDTVTREMFRADLEPLVEVCSWTGGYWDFGGGDIRKWNEVQNTSKDVNRLANLLLVQYKQRVWSRCESTPITMASNRTAVR
ncbi:MAG TPA: DGQHR domain-containing protein DpdB [Blastocatellia bacterium]|nr:DGQHR domain-containing protein DpdB [Blastocatellia bacterium]